MNLDRLAGNTALKRQLSAQAEGRGLSHAYLISGPAGAGKSTLAQLLAAAMVCTSPGEKPCLACPACKKVLSGIHPDVIHIDIPEGKKEILVEQARSLRSDAWIRPNEASRKVYIIHNAHTMNENAQNAILKLLEEGPAYAAFLLLAENPAALLTTIRSRCESAVLAPPREAGPDPNDPANIAALELMEVLSGGDELALYAWSLPLEKWPRADFIRLLARSVALFRAALAPSPGDPPQILPLTRQPRKKLLLAAEAMEELRRQSIPFNLGTGHLAGAVCSALGELFF